MIDAIHTGRDVGMVVRSAAQTVGCPVNWLAVRVATFRKGRERPIIVAALKSAGLIPVAQ